MAFFNEVKNIVFTVIIVILSTTLIAVSVVFALRGAEINEAYLTASSELETTRENLAATESEKSSVESQLEAERQERQRLEQENAGLKSEIEQLKAKKAEEEAKKLALQQQQQAQQVRPPQTPPPATKVCYLTFDDGPCENTLAILNILARYNAKATFFVKGNSKCIDYVKNIKDAGHAVGLHTYTHDYKQLYASDAAYFNDLNAVSAAVEQRIGNVKLVRFPGGSSNEVSKHCPGIMTRLTKSVPEAGYAYFDWNVDSGDAMKFNSQQIIEAVLSQASKKSGAICVLMHDIKINTTQALPSVIEGLIQQGYYFDVLSHDSYGFHHGVKN